MLAKVAIRVGLGAGACGGHAKGQVEGTRGVSVGPLLQVRRWKRNVYLAMVVHCSLNSVGLLVTPLLLGGA
jgi:hypothetical protein